MIEVVDVVEHENGDATYTFEMDRTSADLFNEIGIRLVLYCHMADMTTEDVFDDLRQKIDNRQVEVEEAIAGRFDEYGHYGENNPPLMSNPGNKGYEV